jgi:hypothetical protein
MIIAAGACYETRKYPNSYNFVQLDLSTGIGSVYLRMYSDKRGGFWTKDVVNYRNVSDGVYEFELPNHLRTKGHGISTPSVKRPEPIKFTFTPPEPVDRQNWLSAFRRITEQHRANGSWTDKNDAEHKINRLEDFLKPFCKGQIYDASFALYSKDVDGNFYEEVMVIVKVKPERELSFEVTDQTQAQRREKLANTIQREISKLKGVRPTGKVERGLSLADERAFIKQELAQHKRNLYTLREKAAVYAAGETPLHLLNQIESEEEEVRRIEAELERLER